MYTHRGAAEIDPAAAVQHPGVGLRGDAFGGQDGDVGPLPRLDRRDQAGGGVETDLRLEPCRLRRRRSSRPCPP